MTNQKLVPTDKINLYYVCGNEEEHASNSEVFADQPLTDIVDCGTLICNECDADMTLQGYAGVTREPGGED